MLTNIFTLQKLTVMELQRGSKNTTANAFSVMFNPKSYQETYGIDINTTDSINGSQTLHFKTARNNTIGFELIFDGTYGHEYLWQRVLKSLKTVNEQIDALFKITGYPERESNETIEHIDPNPLLLSWGRLKYYAILEQVKIDYTLFDRDGQPTRATVNTVFHAINPEKSSLKLQGKDYQGKPVPALDVAIK